MSLPNYLNKIKSAGIYRFTFDKSEVSGEQAETMRLVVGYSEKGPFNTLVYIETISEFEEIFGGVNKKLERRGCFFHRLAEQALTTGPILVINLKPFNTDKDNPEQVRAVSFNPTDSRVIKNASALLEIDDIYDTTRFWHLEPDGLSKRFAERTLAGEEKYITITATDSSNTTGTIFFRAYQPSGYDISFREWYASVLNGEELPSYLEGHEMDKVGEYFAEVYVFRGRFTTEIATSEVLSKYFDIEGTQVKLKPYIENVFGDRQDTLAALAADSNSGFINSYSGILLPNFQGPNGGYLSLNLMFNAGQDDHKMMMDMNLDALYDGTITIDQLNTTGWEQVGKAMAQGTAIGSVSLTAMSLDGVTPVVSLSVYDEDAKEWKYDVQSDGPQTYAEPDFYSFDITGRDLSVNGYTITGGPELSQIGSAGDKFIIKTQNANDSDVAVLTKVETSDGVVEVNTERIPPVNGSGITPTDFDIDQLNKDGDLKVKYACNAVKMECTWGSANIPPEDLLLTVTPHTAPGGILNTNWASKVVFSAMNESGFVARYSVMGRVDSNGVATFTLRFASSYAKKLFEEITTQGASTDITLIMYVPESLDGYTLDIARPLITADDWSVRFTNLVEENESDPSTSATISVSGYAKRQVFGVEHTTFTFDRLVNQTTPLYNSQLIRCNHPVYASCQNITPTVLDGYVYGLKLPGSNMYDKLEWQNKVLDTLTRYDGIRTALTNRRDSEFHYLVDSFESYVSSELKSQLGTIAKEKDNCLALVNFPSMQTFKNCPYSSYTDKNGKLQVKYIAEGYNHMKPASVNFTLMSEYNGASFVSYNTPIVLTDGTIKTVCPSAALVSNDFMAKYDTRFPYSIVAGPTYGRITFSGLVGPDFNFSRADLDILEPMGVNCMVYVPRKGTYINSNQTAKQNPVTALSKINVRELVIYLQDEIESLLEAYSWEFNTQELRDTIKSKADTICETVKSNGGLYEYLNVCDSTNNTPEIIDNEMLILDTSIEPGRGAGKMVQRLYIYRTGALKAMMM